MSNFTRRIFTGSDGHTAVPTLFVYKLSQRVCYVAERVTWSGTSSEPAQVYAYYRAEGRADSCISGHHLTPAWVFSVLIDRYCNLSSDAGLRFEAAPAELQRNKRQSRAAGKPGPRLETIPEAPLKKTLKVKARPSQPGVVYCDAVHRH